jgi:adenine-specific DNA glycosylase
MTIQIGHTADLTNTQFAPLTALSTCYLEHHTLEPLNNVQIPMKMREYSSADKLTQILLSILAGCETLSEVNVRLRSEQHLAALWGWPRFADQSSLSRTLDWLTQKQIDQLRQNTQAIWKTHSQARAHDWRQYLWLDYDLSGLPCSPKAEESQKGFFSDKKTPQVVN